MRSRHYQRLTTLGVSLTLSLILCAIIQPSLALPQSSNPISRGIGGVVGAASGAIAGGVAGANAGASSASGGSDGNSSLSASASASQNSGGSGGSGSASLSASANLSSSGSSNGGGSGSSSSSGSGLSASGSASLDTSSSSMSSQASISIGSTTPKPEGLVDKVKEIFKGGKEMIKNSVDSLTKDDKKDESKLSAEASASASGGSGGSQVSGGASLSMSGGGSSGSGSSSSGSGGSLSASANLQSSGSQSSGSASASVSVGSTPKPEGLLNKMSKIAERGKEAIKDVINPKQDSSSSASAQGSNSGSLSASASASGSVGGGGGSGVSGSVSGGSSSSGGGMSMNANANINLGKSDDGMKKFDARVEEKKEGPIDKVQKIVAKGTDAIRETVHSIEDKATSVTDKISKAMDDNIKKPMQSASGSGTQTSEGQLTLRAQATAQLKGADREKHLLDVKHEQESKLSRPSSLKEVVTEAKSKGIIPQNEDRSVLRGNHADEKSVAVEVFDKAHEISKIPVESVLKPIDKMLGYEKDPLMRIYDNSHEILRRPLSLVSKPVESVLTGAFKTSDEAKKESDRLLATTSEQERREAKMKEERQRKEDRSVTGSIADKTVELATKPIEIVLKPFDHVLGFDKDGKKNPILRVLDEIYGLSKKPVDALAKPFESILKKMADGEQLYQVSLRFNDESSDPKLVTRLADGALNVADRVLTKPLEIVMKPLNHALGYDEPGKKNPIMEAAHQLKNATKIGVELFTKPIDRIIKEIADIGESKSDAERDADFERQKQEASRLVAALDKLHEVIQYPFEIVLRPMSKVLGTNKGGRKDPLLRAWDVIHQVVRTPIQVISKPVEEALLGDRARKQQKGGISVQAKASANGQQGQAGSKATIGANIGPIKAGAQISLKGGNNQNNQSNDPHKKNIITDSIKTVEKFATKPLDVITSPIRKMILGEDNEKVGSETDKNNREIQAKAQIGAGGSKAQASAQFKGGPQQGGKHPDKIMKTLEKMNNVMLKPLEEITQPISDILSSEKKIEVKAQVSGQPKQEPQRQQQQQQKPQQQQMTASAQAQIKRN